LNSDLTILLSLLSLGFFGGFSHCIGMCAPFVLSQVNNKLATIPLAQFSNFEKIKNLALIPYHLGRITTYSLIGFCCSLFSENVKKITEFQSISALFLFIASLTFLSLTFQQNPLKILLLKLKNKLPFKSKSLEIKLFKNVRLQKVLSFLFKNPQGFRGYLLGLILGFIPCGLLYGAFLLAAAISSPINAAFGMFLFGIATFPALFLSASGGYFFFKNLKKEFKVFSKIVLIINFITLFIMAISLIV